MPPRRARGALAAITLTLGLILVPRSAAADTPVSVAMDGFATVMPSAGAPGDWELPGCANGTGQWVVDASTIDNVDVDTVGSIYTGQLDLRAIMTSTTPCADIDTGSLNLDVWKPDCFIRCVASDGSMVCSGITGTFLRIAADLLLVADGSCSINGRPTVTIQLTGTWVAPNTVETTPFHISSSTTSG